MGSKTRRTDKRVVGKEIGAVRKQWRNRISVALVYPNRYFVGMSNLGFQTVYRLLNSMDAVVCERVFLPEPDASPLQPLVSVESGRRVIDFDIVAFSISFENDYANLLSILAKNRYSPPGQRARNPPSSGDGRRGCLFFESRTHCPVY